MERDQAVGSSSLTFPRSNNSRGILTCRLELSVDGVAGNIWWNLFRGAAHLNGATGAVLRGDENNIWVRRCRLTLSNPR
jgi:hypothetical protein